MGIRQSYLHMSEARLYLLHKSTPIFNVKHTGTSINPCIEQIRVSIFISTSRRGDLGTSTFHTRAQCRRPGSGRVHSVNYMHLVITAQLEASGKLFARPTAH
jgi:hypothetical protein